MQTTQRSSPSRSPSSTNSRVLRSSEPWCSAMMPAQSGRAASRRLVPDLGGGARVGEDERGVALVDRGDDLAAGAGVRSGPDHGNRSMVGGISESTCSALGTSPRTIRPGFGAPAASTPSSASRATSRLPSVAESPQRAELGTEAAEARERELGLHARAWRRAARATRRRRRSSRSSNSAGASSRVSSSERLSGVVTSAVGQAVALARADRGPGCRRCGSRPSTEARGLRRGRAAPPRCRRRAREAG